MKDSKFQELLNLYLDHEISAADSALLEAEIQQNPKRRQIYREYCKMQKACTLLASQFRDEAAATEGQVIAFETPRRRLAPLAYATGLLAAAACAAFVFIQRSDHTAPAQAPQTLAAVETPAPAIKAELPALQPVFRGIRRDDVVAPQALAHAEAPALDWMTRVQFERVPAELLRFDSTSQNTIDDLAFKPRRVFDVRTEGAAFRFQK